MAKKTGGKNTKATNKQGNKVKKAALKEINDRLTKMDKPDAFEKELNDAIAVNPKAEAKSGTKGKATKPAKTPTKELKTPVAKPPKKAKKMSALDAAAKVLSESKEPMRAIDLITEMEKDGLWTSPGGKTPEATLYAAIIREIANKKDKARFKKHDRGVFVAGKGA